MDRKVLIRDSRNVRIVARAAGEDNGALSSQVTGAQVLRLGDFSDLNCPTTERDGLLKLARRLTLAGEINHAKLPSAFDPAAENRKALEAVATSGGLPVPMPFVLAIATQESGAQHYHVPQRGDDRFIVLGLDHNDPAVPARVTSRGYGLGRYTLFHHPPRPEETGTFIIDPVGNVRQAARTLRDKFDHFVVASPADRADDRAAEHPLLPLRECRYAPSDPRYLRDCRACASAVGKVDIVPGMRHYAGAASSYEPNQYYASATYFGVPNRAAFLCDWPYAVRRYNGSGNSSFNYQARVLLNLLHPSA